MDTIFAPPVAANTDDNERTYNARVKLIRKLRWIGMDDEVARLQSGMKADAGAAHLADSVIASPRDTD